MRTIAPFAVCIAVSLVVVPRADANPIRVEIGGWDGSRTVHVTRYIPDGFKGGVIHLGDYPVGPQTLRSGFDLGLIFGRTWAGSKVGSLVSVSGPESGTIAASSASKTAGQRLTGGYRGTADAAALDIYDSRAGVLQSALAPFLDPKRVHFRATITRGGRGHLSTDLVIDPPTAPTPTKAALAVHAPAIAPALHALAANVLAVPKVAAHALATHKLSAQTLDASAVSPKPVPEPSTLAVFLTAGVIGRGWWGRRARRSAGADAGMVSR